jgi:dTDP-4-dehydrorhamnose reductase
MKILLLGHKGMLGHMVKKYLGTSTDYEVYMLHSRFPSDSFKESVLSHNWDYIINCIGAIPQRTKNFSVNYELPIWLEKNTTSRIIHPGTDCETNDNGYSISKKQSRDFIVEKGTHTKVLKTSIIGPELGEPSSLMDWFLSQEGEVGGYTEAMWNGNTTLTWAKECLSLIHNWDDYETETILEGECLSKFDLLNHIKEVFEKNIQINPNDKVKINKCLIGNKNTIPIREQLKELKKYYF